ncbi:DUF397 domain-containing protein [Streptomyces desertarenae]|uniref:DUF397 domain-containing protein n=1 Tax=Streptomyces desertarenae TaxID=2666184 RepID=A0ABW4PJ37_9ACTN
MIVDRNADHGEIELRWRKSSHSGSGGGRVEVALASGAVHARGSKAQAEAVPAFHREQWAAFTAYAREITV